MFLQVTGRVAVPHEWMPSPAYMGALNGLSEESKGREGRSGMFCGDKRGEGGGGQEVDMTTFHSINL